MADQKFSSILIECVGDEVAKSTPVTSRDGLDSIRDGRCLRMMGVRLKSGDIAKAAQVTAADWVRLGQFFWGLGHIETFHSGLNTGQLNVKGHLEMVADPQNKFPENFQYVANCLIAKFSSQNWGLAERSKEAATSSTPKKRANNEGTASGSASKRAKRASLDKNNLRRPPPDHEIFGNDGPMRGILRYKNKAGVSSYAIDDQYKCGNAKVFGANGFAVGTWFPQVLAALRDGCHGEKTAGIAGDLKVGAWSIVVNKGEYKDVDKDLGDTIIYSSPGSFATKSETSDMAKRGTRCLLASLQSKHPVRVIRGQTSWKRAPFVGYRYDGLFQVEETGEEKNAEGGAYTWFRLERLKGQESIPKHCPNRDQRAQAEKIAAGY